MKFSEFLILILIIKNICIIQKTSCQDFLAKWISLSNNLTFIDYGFEGMRDIWHERNSQLTRSNYKFVRFDNDNIILNYLDDGSLVKLTDSAAFTGKSEDEIVNKLADGLWIKKPLKQSLLLTKLKLDKTILETNLTENIGEWQRFQMCPAGTYAIGFNVRVQVYDKKVDNTGLNAIELICNDYQRTNITSYEGFWGEWGKVVYCPNNEPFVGFKVKFDPIKEEPYDNTALNSIRMYCSNDNDTLTELKSTVEGEKGIWKRPKYCEENYSICGIQIKYKSPKSKDNIGLNDLKFYCCN